MSRLVFWTGDVIPVDPDAPTARDWLKDELADPIYHRGPSLIERVFNWITDFFSRLFKVGADSNPLLLALIVLAVVGVIVAVAFLVAGPIRRRRRAPTSAQVLADETRSAAELRASAAALAATAQWRDAVLDQFRALVRSLEERAVLDEQPGRTADEAARAAADRFPALASELAGAGQTFDHAFYGERPMTQDAYGWLCDLDERLMRTRPELTAALAGLAGQGGAS